MSFQHLSNIAVPVHLTTDSGSFYYPSHTVDSLQSVNSSHLHDTPSTNNAQDQNPFLNQQLDDTPSTNNAQDQNPFLNQQLDDTGSQRPFFHLDQVNPSFSRIIQSPANHTLQPPASHTIQPPTNPQYPMYADVQERINSFLCWPTHHCHNPVHLAEAGFFYQDVADSVTCFFCGLALRYWQPHDDVVDKHHQHQPHCQHVLQILQKLREKLLKRIKMKPVDGLTSVEVPLLTTKDAVMQNYPDVHSSQTVSCVKFSILERENKILKDKLTCKVCKAAPANEMTLPCGHLVACQECVRSLTDCVSCHNTIIASVTVYLV